MGLGFSLKQFSLAIVTSLTASVLTRTSAVSAYPPTISFTRPIDWQDGDKAVMQWSLDPTFTTGVSETATPQTITAAVTTYNFGLSAIVSGVYYMRLGAWRGARPGSLNWSNIQGVGDAVAPTITSAATASGYQFVAGTFALTASKAVTWAIVGGADLAQFSISGSSLSWVAQSGTLTLTVQVQATSLFGIQSTVQTITDTVAVNTPSAFSFTSVTNSSLSTAYTSNTITVAGLTGGAIVPVTVAGGTYSKNGGAFVSTADTAVNGDTFAVKETSPAANNGTSTASLTIGATSATYQVSSPVSLSTTTAWNNADKAVGITISGTGSLTAAGNAAGGFEGVRGTASKVSGKRQIELTVNSVGNSFNTGIGFANATASLTAYIGTDTNGTTYFHTGFVGYNGGAGTYATFTVGDKIGAVWDQAAATVTYYKNGVSQGTISTANLNATLFPSFCDQGGGNGTLNTGGTAFAYPVAGALAWDV